MDGPLVGDWLRALEHLYPASWAEEWDSTGLQAGDRGWPAPKALVALDPTAEVVAEAGDRGCGVLIAHHPLLFRPLDRLDLGEPTASVVAEAIRRRVAVVACHTNADVAAGGVSDALADALGVEVSGALRSTAAGSRVKLVTFCPPEATGKVLDAVAAAGGGIIGEYSHCSFRVRGTGSFRPSGRANPVVGEREELNEVEEDRLEMVVPRDRLDGAVRALLDAHPYEEVAYDLYPLAGASGLGLGRVGRLAEPADARSFAERCADRLGAPVRMAGPSDREIRSVALCGGSGGSLVPEAISSGVDALITGDVKHHQALHAAAAGLAVLDAGHHATEWPFVPVLADRLGATGEVLVSETDTNPFR